MHFTASKLYIGKGDLKKKHIINTETGKKMKRTFGKRRWKRWAHFRCLEPDVSTDIQEVQDISGTCKIKFLRRKGIINNVKHYKELKDIKDHTCIYSCEL